MVYGLVDTHAHLNDDALWDDRVSVLARSRAAGLCGVLCVGCDALTSERALELSACDPMVVPAVGIHPTNILQASVADFESVERWASMPQVAAIGETGLDFYWESTPHERQREVFQWHLDLARRLGLPVTVHSRNAEDAVLEELRLIPPPGGVLHCFGGARDVASRALDMGLYIGVDGPVTYKKSCDLQDLVRWLPLDRMLVETDSPYLSPHPFRGKLNDPSRLLLIVEKIAELRKITSQEVARATTNNAFHLFPRLASRIRVSRSIPEE